MTANLIQIEYLKDTPTKIFGLMYCVAREGDIGAFNMLEVLVLKARQSRDSLTHEERFAVSRVLEDSKYEHIRSGRYLEPVYELITMANNQIYSKEGFVDQEKLIEIFTEGVEGIERDTDTKRGEEMNDDLNNRRGKSFLDYLKRCHGNLDRESEGEFILPFQDE